MDQGQVVIIGILLLILVISFVRGLRRYVRGHGFDASFGDFVEAVLASCWVCSLGLVAVSLIVFGGLASLVILITRLL